ncbi:MAG: AMP-binding protein [Terracidiphilus sp.]|nr:AMP-binding protein [Terracidiphilus sp.]
MSQIACAMETSRLNGWAAERLGIPAEQLTRAAIERSQLEQLNASIDWMRARSAFYRPLLMHLPSPAFESLDTVQSLPFTTVNDLAQNPNRFLCTSQDRIQRIVTLPTSGTVCAKRIFFTAEDLERTAEYFAHGVLGVAEPGETMAIALPGLREESVGQQLAKGISRSRIRAVLVNPDANPYELLDAIERTEAASVIGLPVQMVSLAYAAEQRRSEVFRNLRSILLCSDHVSASMVTAIRARFSGEVFEHYGMTETGLGFGIDCHAHAGYHFRELDFLVEIIDPATGERLPDGYAGEVVLTTLTRRGMPLLRYRTGDLSSMTHAVCACGSSIARLQRISGRIENQVCLGRCGSVSLSELDEVLFAIPGIMDFSVQLAGAEMRLQIAVAAGYPAVEQKTEQALQSIPAIRTGCSTGEIMTIVTTGTTRILHRTAKRSIEVVDHP